MSTRSDIPTPRDGADERGGPRVLTVPNLFTVIRMAGSGALLWLAWTGLERWFLAVFVLLMLTDWIDGKLAVLLHQRTVLGARLDSLADTVMYAVLLVGTTWLEPDFVRAEAVVIGAMVGSYVLSLLVAVARFRRLPAYHTRAAKTCWLFVSIGAITLLAEGPSWPARVAMIAVIVTNLEAVAISFVLAEWRTNVASIFHALRRRGRE